MWNFLIDDECKASTLTDEILLTTDKLKIDGKLIPSIKKNAMFRNIVEKHLKMLKLMAKKHKFFSLQKIESGEEVIYITHIKSTKENLFLFDVFRKLGFPTPSIDIGITYGVNTLRVYLTKKLNKVMEKLTDTVKSQVLLYLLSVAIFLERVNEELIENSFILEYSEFDNTICFTNLKTDFKDLIVSFKDFEIVNVVDFDDIESIDKVDFINTQYTGINTLIDNEIIGSYTVCDRDDGEKCLIFKHGIPESLGSYIVLGTDTSIIETNNAILMDDLSENSFISHIVDKLGAEVCVLSYVASKEDAIFPGTHKYECIDMDVSKFENVLKYLSSKGITDKIPLKTLKEMFGDCFKSSLIEIDRSTFVEQYKDDEFAKALLDKLAKQHTFYETFKLPFSNDFLKGILTGDVYSMLFTGDSGTGKSTAAKVICDRIGLPLVTINLSLNCEESDIFGCMIPNPYKEKPEDPEFIWKDGPATRAIRNGYAVAFEEINGGRPGVLMKLNSLLDDTRQIELSSGEIVNAHKNFRIFGTCNIGYEGTNRFSQALVNRFEVIKIFEEPEKDEAFEIIRNRLGYTNTGNMESIWTVYKATKKYCEENNLDVIISIRQLLNIFRIGKYYKNAREAYIDIVLNNAFLEEQEHLHNFIDTVLNALPLTFKI